MSRTRLTTPIALGLLLVLVMGFGPAAAGPPTQPPPTHPKDVERLQLEVEVPVADGTHRFNSNAFDLQKIATVGDYQYTVFWAGNLHLTVARRDLRTDEVQTLELSDQLSRPNDPHNNTVLGVSEGDGRLHLSYDHHNAPLRYRQSRAGFLTDPPEEMSEADFSPRRPLVPHEPEHEKRVTYPKFFNDPDGILYFEYRANGGSGNGDTFLHRHDPTLNTWDRLGIVLGRSGTYPDWSDSTSRNGYPQDLLFDDDGRLHMTWAWRETSAWPSNHDLSYAYSDDGGVTWHNNDGQQVADLDAGDPIELVDDTEVVDVPVHSWFMNNGAMVLDGGGQPHVLTYRSTVVTADAGERDLHYVHYHRTADGTWHERYLDDPEVDLPTWTAKPHPEPLRRGDLLLDGDGNLHALLPVAGKLYTAVARAGTGWADWRISLLDDGPMLPLEHGPKYDRSRWKRDGVLSLAYSRRGEDGNRFLIQDYMLAPGRPPGTPELSQARSAGEDPEIQLVWDGAVGAESYEIRRRAEGEEAFTILEAEHAERSPQSQYVDRDVDPEMSYTYRITAHSAFGSSETAALDARVPVNHARNAVVRASSHHDAYPPELTVDGDTSTFWVSGGPATEDSPQWLELDFGVEREVARLEVTPRPSRFGPRDVIWQVADGDGGWNDVAEVVADASETTGVDIATVTTTGVRLVATSGHDDWGPHGSNRNVQVAELAVYNW